MVWTSGLTLSNGRVSQAGNSSTMPGSTSDRRSCQDARRRSQSGSRQQWANVCRPKPVPPEHRTWPPPAPLRQVRTTRERARSQRSREKWNERTKAHRSRVATTCVLDAGQAGSSEAVGTETLCYLRQAISHYAHHRPGAVSLKDGCPAGLTQPLSQARVGGEQLHPAGGLPDIRISPYRPSGIGLRGVLVVGVVRTRDLAQAVADLETVRRRRESRDFPSRRWL